VEKRVWECVRQEKGGRLMARVEQKKNLGGGKDGRHYGAAA